MDERSTSDQILNRMASRKTLLQWGAAAAIASTAASVVQMGGVAEAVSRRRPSGGGFGGFELQEATIARMQAAMQAGAISSRELVLEYLDRIRTIDKRGPSLNSVIEVNPDALAIAATLDRERAAGRSRGPLHGVPILIKDNIGTADRMQTTAGSLALVGRPQPYDAFVVTQLRRAGAVILGKTNLSEWANFRSTHSTSGWSGRGGQNRNPYVLDRNPSGSSSGSAVAAAANLAAGALGTETDGSIVSPSGVNGVVGIKPTLGLTGRSGVVPISHSQDVVGPIARTVADAAAILSAIAGHDPTDRATGSSIGRRQPDYTRFLDPNGLRGARLGIARQFGFGSSEKEDEVINAAIDTLRRLGATVIDEVTMPGAQALLTAPDELTVLLYDFKVDINRYLQSRGSTVDVHSLADLIRFNEQHAKQELPYFGQELFHMAEAKGPLSSPEYRKARANNRRNSRQRGIDYAMAKHHLDALVAPTNAPAWTIDLVDGDHFLDGTATPAAVAGYPALTVPAGFIFELPIGITFFGRAYSEPTLIKIASGFEAQSRVRRQPRFLPSVP